MVRFRSSLWSIPIIAIGSISAWQVSAADINFEGLLEGEIVSELSTGFGISGNLNGTVGVFGFNPAFGAGTNAAVIFDSDCIGGCTGGDVDLGSPNSDFGGPGIDADGDPNAGGNAGSPFQNDVALFSVLIVDEHLTDGNGDGLVDNPDDADLQGEFIEFDFSNVKGGGTVSVDSVTYMDNDEGEFNAQIELFGPKIPNQFIALQAVGDNGVNTISGIGVDGVSLMRIVLNGSGAVTNVVVNENLPRPCWVTLGGFQNASVISGPKQCTFGGNVGPPPSGALEVNFHSGVLDGFKFHTNDIQAIQCLDSGSTGPQQPGGKKGLEVDTLEFECTGRLNNLPGYTCSGFFKDGGEPAGKKGNDKDEIHVEIFDPNGAPAAECIGELDGGNIQIHPAKG